MKRNRAVSVVAGVSIAAIFAFVVALAVALVRTRAESEGRRVAEADAREQADLANERAETIRVKAQRDADYLAGRDLAREIDELWPAHPERAPAMKEWLEGARPLARRLEAHRLALAAMKEARDGSAEAARQQELVGNLEKIERGVPEIAKRMDDALAFGRRMERFSDDWGRALEAIARDSRYGGLEMRPISGLVPLGVDPESGLWEFWQMETGEEPRRDEAGRLRMGPETAMVLVLVPEGTFGMGSDASPQRDEKPAHEVRVPAFLVSKYEMTQGQWKRLTQGEEPSYYKGDLTRPVEQVSWEDCVRVLPRAGLRLPAEAEWEYAARAGTMTDWWTGDVKEDLRTAGNLADRTGVARGLSQGESWDDGQGPPCPVGIYRANPFGLFDMIGNVWEWCLDTHQEGYEGAPTNGSAWVVEGASNRVGRGGSYASTAAVARSADRDRYAASARGSGVGARPAMGIATR